MEIDGRCHCGQIRYHATIDPERVVICHCTDCQEMSGSAYRAVAFTEPDAFTLDAGELRIYVKTTAASGNPRAQGFCAECGSGIYATSVGEGPKVYGLRLGTISQRGNIAPKRQIWHASALSWVDGIGDLPAVDHQS